jgi:hypothetical protein
MASRAVVRTTGIGGPQVGGFRPVASMREPGHFRDTVQCFADYLIELT